MTEEKKNNNSLKVVLGILIALLLGSGAFMFKMHNDAEDEKNELISEKEGIQNDLNEMIKQYDEKIAENKVLNQDLINERESLALTLDSLRESQATVSGLLKFKSRYYAIKDERDRLFKENEELVAQNKGLKDTIQLKNTEISSQMAINDSLSMTNMAQASTIAKAKELNITSLKGIAVIERSSGKQVNTMKAKRTDKVKVCFAVPQNKVADDGDRLLFLQVIDPARNVIGDKETINIGDKSLTYSKALKFYYKKESIDICEYISAEKFEKGTYVVNVFNGGEMISSTNFSLE